MNIPSIQQLEEAARKLDDGDLSVQPTLLRIREIKNPFEFVQRILSNSSSKSLWIHSLITLKYRFGKDWEIIKTTQASSSIIQFLITILFHSKLDRNFVIDQLCSTLAICIKRSWKEGSEQSPLIENLFTSLKGGINGNPQIYHKFKTSLANSPACNQTPDLSHQTVQIICLQLINNLIQEFQISSKNHSLFAPLSFHSMCRNSMEARWLFPFFQETMQLLLNCNPNNQQHRFFAATLGILSGVLSWKFAEARQDRAIVGLSDYDISLRIGHSAKSNSSRNDDDENDTNSILFQERFMPGSKYSSILVNPKTVTFLFTLFEKFEQDYMLNSLTQQITLSLLSLDGEIFQNPLMKKNFLSKCWNAVFDLQKRHFSVNINSFNANQLENYITTRFHISQLYARLLTSFPPVVHLMENPLQNLPFCKRGSPPDPDLVNKSLNMLNKPPLPLFDSIIRSLLSCICTTLSQMIGGSSSPSPTPVNNNGDSLSEILNDSFIVQRFPPQILKNLSTSGSWMNLSNRALGFFISQSISILSSDLDLYLIRTNLKLLQLFNYRDAPRTEQIAIHVKCHSILSSIPTLKMFRSYSHRLLRIYLACRTKMSPQCFSVWSSSILGTETRVLAQFLRVNPPQNANYFLSVWNPKDSNHFLWVLRLCSKFLTDYSSKATFPIPSLLHAYFTSLGKNVGNSVLSLVKKIFSIIPLLATLPEPHVAIFLDFLSNFACSWFLPLKPLYHHSYIAPVLFETFSMPFKLLKSGNYPRQAPCVQIGAMIIDTLNKYFGLSPKPEFFPHLARAFEVLLKLGEHPFAKYLIRTLPTYDNLYKRFSISLRLSPPITFYWTKAMADICSCSPKAVMVASSSKKSLFEDDGDENHNGAYSSSSQPPTRSTSPSQEFVVLDPKPSPQVFKKFLGSHFPQYLDLLDTLQPHINNLQNDLPSFSYALAILRGLASSRPIGREQSIAISTWILQNLSQVFRLIHRSFSLKVTISPCPPIPQPKFFDELSSRLCSSQDLWFSGPQPLSDIFNLFQLVLHNHGEWLDNPRILIFFKFSQQLFQVLSKISSFHDPAELFYQATCLFTQILELSIDRQPYSDSSNIPRPIDLIFSNLPHVLSFLPHISKHPREFNTLLNLLEEISRKHPAKFFSSSPELFDSLFSVAVNGWSSLIPSCARMSFLVVTNLCIEHISQFAPIVQVKQGYRQVLQGGTDDGLNDRRIRAAKSLLNIVTGEPKKPVGFSQQKCFTRDFFSKLLLESFVVFFRHGLHPHVLNNWAEMVFYFFCVLNYFNDPKSILDSSLKRLCQSNSNLFHFLSNKIAYIVKNVKIDPENRQLQRKFTNMLLSAVAEAKSHVEVR